ncbi:hypothetical protein QR680_007468 [Steinernema hermaphroditum]|uniref:Sulfur globule protein CV3 n=1 Tax=Steinernema hermaphroditum TaxID=289476 RepID=A0AA39IDB2_9BILA|nr:hypothetical protein QR680_007468 [Steinernema hermaphroditum]
MAFRSLLLGLVAVFAFFALSSAGEFDGYNVWGYGNPWTGYWALPKGYGVGYPGYGHIFARGYPGHTYGKEDKAQFLEGYPEYDNGYGYGHPAPAYGGYGYGHEH